MIIRCPTEDSIEFANVTLTERFDVLDALHRVLEEQEIMTITLAGIKSSTMIEMIADLIDEDD